MNEMYEMSGLIFGVIFGILLQRARIVRFDKQVSMLLLRDFTVLKYLWTAALTGMVLVFGLYQFWLLEILERPLFLLPTIVGSLIFGLGWAIYGYCPGTSLGALGEGRWDTVWGILGAILAVLVYDMLIHPQIVDNFMQIGMMGDINLAISYGLSPWLLIVPLVLLSAAGFWWLEKRGL